MSDSVSADEYLYERKMHMPNEKQPCAFKPDADGSSRLDQDRTPTDAEIELVMGVFRCSREEAGEILGARPDPAKRAEISGMIAAARLDNLV